MKLDREKMKALAEKNDGELWAEIRKVAKENGYNLPEAAPSADNLKKIRAVLSGNEKFNYADALRILSSYKKGGR